MTEKEKVLTQFASNLKKLREVQGISIRELAVRSDLEYSQVQRIEKGKVNIALTTVVALAEGLGISPDLLLKY
jgi:transcriptional regulator with XRE-family HTH domain